MSQHAKRLLIVTAEEPDNPSWELAPVYQLAAYCEELAQADLDGQPAPFEIVGVWELTGSGQVVPVRYEVSLTAGEVKVFFADGTTAVRGMDLRT